MLITWPIATFSERIERERSGDQEIRAGNWQLVVS